MGTPEFCDLGKRCAVEGCCKGTDFLPFSCDSCCQDFCLDHRSYTRHSCPKADRKDVIIVICPLCAEGVRLIADEDPNITWETHVDMACDPSNYGKLRKLTFKRKCPVPGCREKLTFTNKIKCRDCLVDHCLKHRFSHDHRCSGPKKLEQCFSLVNLLARKEELKPMRMLATSSPKWAARVRNAASSVRASAGAGMAKLGSEISQAWQMAKDGLGQSSSGRAGEDTQVEECPQCGSEFSSLTTLIEHFEKVHERSGNRGRPKKATVDFCPECSDIFCDPVALVQHVERDHGGTSKAWIH